MRWDGKCSFSKKKNGHSALCRERLEGLRGVQWSGSWDFPKGACCSIWIQKLQAMVPRIFRSTWEFQIIKNVSVILCFLLGISFPLSDCLLLNRDPPYARVVWLCWGWSPWQSLKSVKKHLNEVWRVFCLSNQPCFLFSAHLGIVLLIIVLQLGSQTQWG